MLQFNSQPRRRPPGTLSRGMQLRMAGLVVGLGLVLAAMDQLRTPEGAATVTRLLRGGAAEPAPADLGPPLLDADALATIKDNTVFREAEADAWFAILAALRDGEHDAALAQAPGPMAYAQLTGQPRTYRGRAVRIAGRLKRVEATTPGPNDAGFEVLYRCLVQGAGGEVWPTTLYTPTAPEGVALGETVDLPVAAAGVFFKNWSYRWQNGLGISPVVLTASIDVTRLPVAAEAEDGTNRVSPWMIVGLSVLAAGVLLIGIRVASRTGAPAAVEASADTLDFSTLSASESDARAPGPSVGDSPTDPQ